MWIKLIILAFLLTVSGLSQKPDPEKILENVKNEYDRINDYSVNVRITVDVEFLKMPDRQATIYYKKPDKFHINSDNFTMLPKTGLNFTPLGFLSYKYTAFFEKEDTIDGLPVSLIKVIPIEGDADVILSTFWIDTKRNLILRIESSRKPQGTFTIDLKYLKIQEKYWLPSSMVFSFTLEPGMMPGRIAEELYKGEKASDESKEGNVYLNYSDYKVNEGLPDSLFEKKDSDK